jgi:hypothetical protein
VTGGQLLQEQLTSISSCSWRTTLTSSTYLYIQLGWRTASASTAYLHLQLLAGRQLTLKVLLELGNSLIESVQFSLFAHASIRLFLKIDLHKACIKKILTTKIIFFENCS